VLVHLHHQGIEGREALLFTQLRHELHLDLAPIEIAREIEHMRLEERVLAAHRRTCPEAGHPWQGLLRGTMHADGKYALHGRTPPLYLEVRRRETQGAPEAVPLDDPAGHRIRPAKPS